MSDDIHKYPSQLAERFQVRLPAGMRDRIAEAAKANKRSMNAEIVARPSESLEADTVDLVKLSKEVDEQSRLIDQLIRSMEEQNARSRS